MTTRPGRGRPKQSVEPDVELFRRYRVALSESGGSETRARTIVAAQIGPGVTEDAVRKLLERADVRVDEFLGAVRGFEEAHLKEVGLREEIERRLDELEKKTRRHTELAETYRKAVEALKPGGPGR